jgi:hypothetical protein
MRREAIPPLHAYANTRATWRYSRRWKNGRVLEFAGRCGFTQLAQDRAEFDICAQVLIYPATDSALASKPAFYLQKGIGQSDGPTAKAKHNSR